MKKKFFGVACILALSGVLTTGQILTNKRNALTNLENANIEAPTGEFLDSVMEFMTFLRCNKPKHSPNMYIHTEEATTGRFVCETAGQLKVLEKIIPGDFKLNLEYEVTYSTKNCEKQVGSCCNQNRVGTEVVSYKLASL